MSPQRKLFTGYVEAIPKAILQSGALHNWDQRTKPGDSKPHKTPVNSSGIAKGYNDPNIIASLDECIRRAKGNGWGLGISLGSGLKLTANGQLGYLFCLDADGFVEKDGDRVDNEVSSILEKLNTYTEISPSGTGFKAFFVTDQEPETKFKIPYGRSEFADAFPDIKKYQTREFEVFSKGSFLTVTGEAYADHQYRELRFILKEELAEIISLIRLNSPKGNDEDDETEETPTLDIPEWMRSVDDDISTRLLGRKKSLGKSHYRKLKHESICKVLEAIDPEDEQAWTNVAFALARGYGEHGREYFHAYSRRCPSKYERNQCDKRFDRALREVVGTEGYASPRLVELSGLDEDSLEWDSEQTFTEGDGAEPSNSPLDPIDEVNAEYVWDKHKLEIYSLSSRMYIRRDGFKTHFANRQGIINGKPVLLGQAWLSSPRRSEVKGLRMSPKEGPITKSGALNTWRGYSCEPSAGDVSPFIRVLEHLLPIEDKRRFVLKFLALLTKEPDKQYKIALAIQSPMQGVGKNTIFEAVKDLFDSQHTKVIGSGELSSNFTEWQVDKVLIIGDEVSDSGDRSQANRMKRYVTATENYVNPKGLPQFSQPNLIKYIFLSNHTDIVHLDHSDRRYYVPSVTNLRLPKELADRFYEWRKYGLPHLLHFFMEYDTTGFDPTAPAPMTDAKEDVIDAAKSSLDTWVDEEISERLEKDRILISTSDVLAKYKLSGGSASEKAIANALKKAGVRLLKKRARLKSGRKVRLFALGGADKFEEMPEAMLGEQYEKSRGSWAN